MSRMMRISLMNDFIFNLNADLQRRIENFVGNDYSMDDERILEEFGLTNEFEEYVALNAA